jgi:hypothetical protein
VPRQGRVRLDAEQARYVANLLGEDRHRLVIRRADAKERGMDPYDWNRQIEFVSRIQNEVERLIAEMGW